MSPGLALDAIARGLLETAIPLSPIPTSEYPTPAERPTYSVLDTSATYRALDLTPVPWRAALGRMLDEVTHDRSTTERPADG